MLEEQVKEKVSEPTPAPPTVDVKVSPFGTGHENMVQDKPVQNGEVSGKLQSVESETDLENEYKEDMINPLADEDPNRKEVRCLRAFNPLLIVCIMHYPECMCFCTPPHFCFHLQGHN